MVEQIATGSAPDTARDAAVSDLELSLLLEAIRRFSGYDFGDYSQAMLKRRVAERLRAENVETISGLQERVLHDPAALARFVLAMSSGHGRLFADPGFFAAFRINVVPLLRTYSFSRVWVPHCARGEDAYSLAAILHEEGLLERTMIYATDPSDLAVSAAKAGRFELDPGDDPDAAHRATGAIQPLSEVSSLDGNSLQFDEALKRQIIFARHALVTDGSLNEFQVILARDVLRQFNKALQFRVHNLFLNSLIRLGFLCLGSSESLALTPHEGVFRRFGNAAIYRRLR
ncbi:MAG TPA: CheR family methyltransferase [Candidatus Cybelea sp.]|jgi:chemotaxis protein methyltransferase CheR|nr:CheR family methyltransferase [Candidatus Cybelea sp.]